MALAATIRRAHRLAFTESQRLSFELRELVITRKDEARSRRGKRCSDLPSRSSSMFRIGAAVRQPTQSQRAVAAALRGHACRNCCSCRFLTGSPSRPLALQPGSCGRPGVKGSVAPTLPCWAYEVWTHAGCEYARSTSSGSMSGQGAGRDGRPTGRERGRRLSARVDRGAQRLSVARGRTLVAGLRRGRRPLSRPVASTRNSLPATWPSPRARRFRHADAAVDRVRKTRGRNHRSPRLCGRTAAWAACSPDHHAQGRAVLRRIAAQTPRAADLGPHHARISLAGSPRRTKSITQLLEVGRDRNHQPLQQLVLVLPGQRSARSTRTLARMS